MKIKGSCLHQTRLIVITQKNGEDLAQKITYSPSFSVQLFVGSAAVALMVMRRMSKITLYITLILLPLNNTSSQQMQPDICTAPGSFTKLFLQDVRYKTSVSDHDSVVLDNYSSQPTRFGFGSFFPGFTSVNSVVSFNLSPISYRAVSVTKGMIDENQPHMQRWRSITESDQIHMLPTLHGAHTHTWRKKLIQAAKHNIIISNYCGHEVLQEILELIKKKLIGDQKLKVVIITLPNFLSNNLALIKELTEKFPLQFSVVNSPNVWFMKGGDEDKKSGNHAKYFGIDWGRYYIMGGSTFLDYFNVSGVNKIFDILSSEENAEWEHLCEQLAVLKAKWKSPNPDLNATTQLNQECILLGEAVAQMLRNSPHFSSVEISPLLKKLSSILKLIRQAASLENPSAFYSQQSDQIDLNFTTDNSNSVRVTNDGLIDLILPNQFRDMDFVFSDSNDGYSSGRQLFLEIVRLAYLWEALNAAHKHRKDISLFTPSQVASLPIFTGDKKQSPRSNDSVTHRIMRDSMPNSSNLSTPTIPGFEGTKTGSLQLLYQGPEQLSGTNEFSSKALELIKNAQKRIVFNHIYFCPTEEIIAALKEAVEQRGVQIEIITCGETANCPMSQKAFGPYNKWNWVNLANKLTPECRQNLKVFLFAQKEIGLHKKVIVFDDWVVLAGSSNFGYKSLVTSSDYEVNFVAKSEDLAQKTLAIFEEDKRLSQEIADLMEISLYERLQASSYHAIRSLVN